MTGTIETRKELWDILRASFNSVPKIVDFSLLYLQQFETVWTFYQLLGKKFYFPISLEYDDFEHAILAAMLAEVKNKP